MEAFDTIHERKHKHQGFRQNIFQPSNPSRVSTDPEALATKRLHLHGLRDHNQKHRHKHSRHVKNTVQSAVQLHPPTSFGDLLKPNGRTKNTSPPRSRRESSTRLEPQNAQPEEPPPPKVVRQEDVSKGRAKIRAQEEALRTSLQDLSDQSLKTSRQLDDTYYSILEKLTVLRGTIGSLQELSGLTKELHESFLSDTHELTDDIRNQFKSFNDFGQQEKNIHELAERLKRGKEKADSLNARLAAARTRVEARAKAEADWEARTNRRLRALWGMLGTVAALMLLALVLQRLGFAPSTASPLNSTQLTSAPDLSSAPIPEDTREAILNPLGTRSTECVASFPSPSVEVTDDARMRIFDEL